MKEKNDFLFGFHSIYEALKADKRKFYKIFISKKRSLKRLEKIEVLAKKREIAIEFVTPEVLNKMADNLKPSQHQSNQQFVKHPIKHQGIVAKTSFYPVKNALEITQLLKKRNHPCFILIMESIEDPHNLGALIRTALCAGVDYILIPKNRCAAPSSTVSRSSAGAMEHADIFMITNTASILRTLKEHNVWISGLDASGDKSLYESDLKGNIALVIGGEHKGIRPGVKKECDFLLSIPIHGRSDYTTKSTTERQTNGQANSQTSSLANRESSQNSGQSNINSLNASVAGGIAMYEALRQRS